jgi:two-component system response regulator HydG
MDQAQILIVDDEESIRYTFENFLVEAGYTVSTAKNLEQALLITAEREFDLFFVDIFLQGRSGIDLLNAIRAYRLDCPVIMITGAPSLDTATEAVRLGAFDYISKPIFQETLLQVTRKALQFKAMQDEKERYRSNLEAIFASIQDAIITVDKDLRILELNDPANKILGIRRDQIGRPFPNSVQGGYQSCYNILRRTLDREKPEELHRLNVAMAGKNRTVTLLSSPLRDRQGRFMGALLIIRDETRLAELEVSLEERQRFHKMIGQSRQMRKIYELIHDLADYQTTVLITGESGTGKELVAEAIHYSGERREKPFVKVNCSALSESLLESELFGHVKGAFTNAIQDKVGRFQRADGGTLLLDEIGDLSPTMQLRLLRVLQEMEFERVGESTPIKVDVRVIAATHQDLSEKVRRGTFRKDLYYRLKVVEIRIPPLRERRDDIPLLVDHFLQKFNQKFHKKIFSVSDEVLSLFMSAAWPGNVRELEHTLEHGCILCREDVVRPEHLPRDFADRIVGVRNAAGLQGEQGLHAILGALEKTAWNKAKAARKLGISRRTLYRKMAEYKIDHRTKIE